MTKDRRVLGRVSLGTAESWPFAIDWVNIDTVVSHDCALYDLDGTDVSSGSLGAPESTMDGSYQISGPVSGASLNIGYTYELRFRANFGTGKDLERIIEIEVG